jgi:hypothetical protein
MVRFPGEGVNGKNRFRFAAENAGAEGASGPETCREKGAAVFPNGTPVKFGIF